MCISTHKHKHKHAAAGIGSAPRACCADETAGSYKPSRFQMAEVSPDWFIV